MYDGSLSTLDMDRGYKEYGFKLSYEHKLSKKNSFGISFNEKNRNYISNILQDKLHYKRIHKEQIITGWFKFKINSLKHKINLTIRERVTDSPENWVIDLKTFKRLDLSYTIYFNKIALKK